MAANFLHTFFKKSFKKLDARIVFLTTFFLFFSHSKASENAKVQNNTERNCLHTHIREALIINKERKPIYSKLSNGESEEVSNLMIWSENILLLIAPVLDLPARYWQKENIPVACNDFVSMSLTPALNESIVQQNMLNVFQKSKNQKKYKVFNTQESMLNLRKALSVSISEAHKVALLEIEKIADEPNFHCMTRHILESAARTLWLLPNYISLAKEKEKLSPEFFSKLLVRVQIESLAMAQTLDEKAALFQIKGIPIVCNDVPYILHKD